MSLRFRPSRILLSLVLLLSLIFIFNISPATAQSPLYEICDNTESYTNTSTFGKNLKILLDYLSISNLDNGFFDSSVSQGNVTVYGSVMCHGDANEDVCQNCIKDSSNEILKKCHNRSATIWYDDCLLRYSNSFIGSSFTPVWVYMWNTQNITDPDQFSTVLGKLMNNLASRAASQPKNGMFARGHTNFSTNSTVYGLVQCLRGLSENNCSRCLGEAIGQIPNCCDTKRGGRVIGAVCNIRYEIYSFYEGSDIEVEDPPSAEPVPPVGILPPSPKTTAGETIPGFWFPLPFYKAPRSVL